MVWNEETIRHLRDLWAEGHSTAEIGRRLGVSKNAIVGKAHRLDLDARPSPIRRETVKLLPERGTGYPRAVTTTLPPLPSDSMGQGNEPSNVQPLRLAPVSAHRAAQPLAPAPSADPRPDTPQPAPARSAAVPDRPRPPVPQVHAKPYTLRQAPPIQVRRAAPSCCWPIGDPGTKAFRFCDDTSLPGKPYCDEHAKLAYVKIRDRKEDAA